MMKQVLSVIFFGLVLTLPLAAARGGDDDNDDGDNDNDNGQYDVDANNADKLADEVLQSVSGPKLPTDPELLQQQAVPPPPASPPPGAKAAPPPPAAAPSGLAAPAAAPPVGPEPKVEDVKVDAVNAKQAADVAKQAAKVANKVAKHSMKVTGHAKKALTHALGALHDARVDSKGLGKQQKESLKKAEAHLREATKKADFGKLEKVKGAKDVQKEKMEEDLKKVAVTHKGGKTEKEEFLDEIEELRRKLQEKNVNDKEILQALDELEAEVNKTDGPINDESKAELERLRQLVDSLEEPAPAPKAVKIEAPESIKPVKAEEDDSSKDASKDDGKAVPVEDKGFDIDTAMPYGELEPFGREDTAQELTEDSIKESNDMVDQLERAEVAEEKRAVFRSLTRLRGAAITSFDGVARSQTGNIDEYNKLHQWRTTHPLHHLADEESDVSKWAFPDNAD